MPAPATHDFVHLEISSASVLNTSVNGPLNYLIGRNLGSDDAIELEDSLEVLSGSGGRYLRLPQGTMGQRPTGAAGMLRFNSTDAVIDFHDGTGWDSVLQASLVDFETLDAAGDVGEGATQLAQGDHSHPFTIQELDTVDAAISFTPVRLRFIDITVPSDYSGDYRILLVARIPLGENLLATLTIERIDANQNVVGEASMSGVSSSSGVVVLEFPNPPAFSGQYQAIISREDGGGQCYAAFIHLA